MLLGGNERRGLSSSVPVQVFRGTRLAYFDERAKTPAGQTLALKTIKNTRQVPLKNFPKSPFQIALSYHFLQALLIS